MDEDHFRWGKMTFHPDPTSRHAYRAVVAGKWSSVVIKGPMAIRSRDDMDGEQMLRDEPVPAADPREAPDPDLILPAGASQWRYRIVSATFGADLERTLNRYGKAGWEVVSISAANGTLTLTGNKIFALMKRPVPPEAGSDR